MILNPGKLEFSEAEHAALIADVRSLMKTEGVIQAQVARDAEIPDSTLSQYLNGKYPNESGKAETAQRLHRWMNSVREARQVRRRLPTPPAYMPLRGSGQIIDALSYAREAGRIVLITGMPGVSKTATASQYALVTPRTWYCPMDTTTHGVPTMLLEILRVMGVTDAKGTPAQLIRRIVDGATAAKSLIIVDEAQHLSPKALEALRSINDRSRLLRAPVGVAIIGNELAYTSVGPTGGKADFAQVSSRVADRQFIPQPDPDDAAQLARAWAEENGEAVTAKDVQFCQQIAAAAGGLRNIEMTMEKAILIARGGAGPLTLDHLKAAYAQLAGHR